MKLTIFLCFMSIQMYSQNNLLVKENGLLKIINYESNNQLVLDTIMHSNIAGYNWKQDSLEISMENQGTIYRKTYKIKDSIIKNLNAHKKFEVSNFKALYFHNPTNSKTLYSYDNIKLFINNGFELNCHINNIDIWKKSTTIYLFRGFGVSGAGYQNPILSNDLKRILISFKSPKLLSNKYPKILEIDVETGKVLNKIKKSTNYSYSNDSELILFKNKNGIPSIFNRKNKKYSYYYSWKNCFWLIRNEK